MTRKQTRFVVLAGSPVDEFKTEAEAISLAKSLDNGATVVRIVTDGTYESRTPVWPELGRAVDWHNREPLR